MFAPIDFLYVCVCVSGVFDVVVVIIVIIIAIVCRRKLNVSARQPKCDLPMQTKNRRTVKPSTLPY